MGRRELQQLVSEQVLLSPRVYAQLQNAYQEVGAQLEAELEEAYKNYAELEAEELRSTREHLLRVERTALQDLRRQGLVDTDIAQELAAAVDARLLALQPPDEAPASAIPLMTEMTPIDRLAEATTEQHTSTDDAQTKR